MQNFCICYSDSEQSQCKEVENQIKIQNQSREIYCYWYAKNVSSFNAGERERVEGRRRGCDPTREELHSILRVLIKLGTAHTDHNKLIATDGIYILHRTLCLFWTVLFSSVQVLLVNIYNTHTKISSKIPSHHHKQPEKDTKQNIDARARSLKEVRKSTLLDSKEEREIDLQQYQQHQRNQPADMAPKSRKKKADGKKADGKY